MKIGKSEYYALIFIQELTNNKKASISEVSVKFDIPSDFLHKIALKLKNSGLIISKEGMKGGYELTKSGSVTLYDVIASIRKDEDDFCRCVRNDACSKSHYCEMYGKMKDDLATKLKEIKLNN